VKRENPKFGLRWLTWPTNTFCAAVAWRNHPPVEGTAATVREAVANLDRVRAVKTGAREAKVAARHEQDLAAERRRTELAAARAGVPDEVPMDVTGAAPESVTVPAPNPTISSGACPAPPAGQVRVPATAVTLARWADAWVRMCADGEIALGPVTDAVARERYRLTARQLRNIRHAATSGALRRRAGELGVVLPAGYVDLPAGGRINSHKQAGVTS
jgi:hypothetical protein